MYIARSLAGTIDILAVTDFDDIDDESIIFNGIDDSIVALTNSVTILCGEFLAARGAGIFRKLADPFDQTLAILLSRNSLNLFDGRGFN